MLNKEKAKPTEGEIIIDVPTALGLMMAAGAWPVKAFFELKNGTLTAPESEITVSPAKPKRALRRRLEIECDEFGFSKKRGGGPARALGSGYTRVACASMGFSSEY